MRGAGRRAIWRHRLRSVAPSVAPACCFSLFLTRLLSRVFKWVISLGIVNECRCSGGATDATRVLRGLRDATSYTRPPAAVPTGIDRCRRNLWFWNHLNSTSNVAWIQKTGISVKSGVMIFFKSLWLCALEKHFHIKGLLFFLKVLDNVKIS